MDGLAIPGDATATTCLEGRVGTGPGAIEDVFPPGFGAFARILHPNWPRGGNGPSVFWGEVFRNIGKELSAEASWFVAMDGFENEDHGLPFTTSLPQPQATSVAEIFMEATETPSTCWFGWPNVRQSPFEPDEPLVRSRRHRRWPRARTRIGIDDAYGSPPGFDNFNLFRGTLADLVEGSPEFVPSLWWPDDHAWFLSTAIDAVSTYVAGSSGTIEALLSDPRLEVLSMSPRDQVVI